MFKQNQQVVEKRDRRSAKGIVVAMSCEIVKIDSEREIYKVQSESNTKKYYIVKFIDGTPVFCSCPDFLNRIKTNPFHVCKHARAIVLAENHGLISKEKGSKSFKEDEYSF